MNKLIIKVVCVLNILLLLALTACSSEKNTANKPTDSKVSDISSETDTSSENNSSTGQNKPTVDPEILKKYSYMPVISEKMPSINIVTNDGSFDFVTKYDREDKMQDLIDYVGATVSVGNCEDEFLLNSVEAEVKVRGNYTLNYEKKPIRIKFSKKQSVLGLNSGKKFKNWVLLADWKDLSMLNNATSFYLGNTILGSDGFYTTDYRNVEVYINGTYWGVYLLAEQQEVKDGRFSVPEVEDGYMNTDIGYMFEYDSYYTEERDMPNGSGDPTFEISYGDAPYTQGGYTVKSDINSAEQLQFIRNYLENVFLISYSAVTNGQYMRFNSDFSDITTSDFTSPKDTVGAVIDLQSLVDTYILNEIACDSDIAWSSFYISVDMSKEGEKKLIFEAPWDFDSAFGMKKKFTATEGLFAAQSANPWLSLLANEDWFVEMVKEKWLELCSAEVPEKSLELIQKQKTVYEQYYKNNYERWPNRILKGNGEVTNELNSYKTQGEAADYLYSWLNRRYMYLYEKWGRHD